MIPDVMAKGTEERTVANRGRFDISSASTFRLDCFDNAGISTSSA